MVYHPGISYVGKSARHMNMSSCTRGAGGDTPQLAHRVDLAKPSSSGEASVPADSFNWRMIWNSPVTPQAKQFLWRLAHNSLPLRWNIQRRGMDIDTRCPLCQRFDEDGAHLFFKCKPVRGLH